MTKGHNSEQINFAFELCRFFVYNIIMKTYDHIYISAVWDIDEAHITFSEVPYPTEDIHILAYTSIPIDSGLATSTFKDIAKSLGISYKYSTLITESL